MGTITLRRPCLFSEIPDSCVGAPLPRRSDRPGAKPSWDTLRSSLHQLWCIGAGRVRGKHAHTPETVETAGESRRIRREMDGIGRVVTARAITMARSFPTPARIILDNRLPVVYEQSSGSVNSGIREKVAGRRRKGPAVIAAIRRSQPPPTHSRERMRVPQHPWGTEDGALSYTAATSDRRQTTVIRRSRPASPSPPAPFRASVVGP